MTAAAAEAPRTQDKHAAVAAPAVPQTNNAQPDLTMMPVPPQRDLVTQDEILQLQIRIERLVSSGVLPQEEGENLMDEISDFVDVRTSDPNLVRAWASPSATARAPEQYALVEKTYRMVGQSASIPADAIFARQLQRKFLPRSK